MHLAERCACSWATSKTWAVKMEAKRQEKSWFHPEQNDALAALAHFANRFWSSWSGQISNMGLSKRSMVLEPCTSTTIRYLKSGNGIPYRLRFCYWEIQIYNCHVGLVYCSQLGLIIGGRNGTAKWNPVTNSNPVINGLRKEIWFSRAPKTSISLICGNPLRNNLFVDTSWLAPSSFHVPSWAAKAIPYHRQSKQNWLWKWSNPTIVHVTHVVSPCEPNFSPCFSLSRGSYRRVTCVPLERPVDFLWRKFYELAMEVYSWENHGKMICKLSLYKYIYI